MKTPCPCPEHLPAIQEAKKDGLTFSKLIHAAERNWAQKMSYIKLIFEYTNNWGPKLAFSCISVNAAQHPWVDGIFWTANGGRIWPLEGCNRKKGECIPLSGFAGELIVFYVWSPDVWWRPCQQHRWGSGTACNAGAHWGDCKNTATKGGEAKPCLLRTSVLTIPIKSQHKHIFSMSNIPAVFLAGMHEGLHISSVYLGDAAWCSLASDAQTNTFSHLT